MRSITPMLTPVLANCSRAYRPICAVTSTYGPMIAAGPSTKRAFEKQRPTLMPHECAQVELMHSTQKGGSDRELAAAT